MATAITEAQVLEALRTVYDPDLRKDLVTLGMVRDLSIEGDRVAFRIVLTTPACPMKDQMKAEAERVVRALPGVREVAVSMDTATRSWYLVSTQKPDPSRVGCQ
jgi:ATP-binding protein involved in chromosome partitioning